MSRSTPKTQEIITYSCIYGSPPPNALDIIKGMCKKSLIYEIVHINHWLNPKNKVYFDNSFATQKEILGYLTKKEDNKLLFKHYMVSILKIIEDQGKSKAYNIFSRVNCLFALEQITNSEDVKYIPDYKINTAEKWKNLIDYLLAINWELINRENKGLEKINENSIESLNPIMLMINELMIESHFTFTPYRAHLLIQYFLNSKTYGQELINYFEKTYQFQPIEFCRRIIEIFMGTSTDDPKFQFYYRIDDEKNFIKKLSQRTKHVEIYKLLGLRKSPFIQVSENEFLLGDKNFLIEKVYSQLINDFWFDWLEPQRNENKQPKFRMDDYRGEFGRFFENYGVSLLKDTFAKYKYSICFGLDELKFGKKRQKELCDFYLRYEKKIILCEVKSGGINDKSKYGGDIESLYNENRSKFFLRYGVDQLVKALINLSEAAPKKDSNFPIGKTITIYPIIVVNEKVFQTPLMAQIFNTRFQEKLLNINLTKYNIKPLTLTHISDWENAEDALFDKPKEIWELLEYHFREKKFIPPFFNTLNRKLIQLKKERKAINRFLNLLDKNSC